VVHVRHRASERALEIFRVVCVPIDLDVDLARFDVLELEAGADAIEDIGILFGGQPGNGTRRIVDQRLDTDRGSLSREGRGIGTDEGVAAVEYNRSGGRLDRYHAGSARTRRDGHDRHWRGFGRRRR